MFFLRRRLTACADLLILVKMGFADLSLLTGMLLSQLRPGNMLDVLPHHVTHLLVDFSHLLHRFGLSRSASVAVLRAYCQPNAQTRAAAVTAAVTDTIGRFMNSTIPNNAAKKSSLKTVSFVFEPSSRRFQI